VNLVKINAEMAQE